eukprot:scaffold1721_cov105-Skeletonema_menzelii.AAC.3
MSRKTPPSTLTKLKLRFMLVDMPAENSNSPSRIYSKKVALRQRPIFWICRSLYPAKASAFAPPHLKEWVSMRSIGMPLQDG